MMIAQPHDLSYQQGSKEWLALRRTKITSTDAAIILGISPYCTPYELYQRKLALIPDIEVTHAMREGNRLEPEAREAYIKFTGSIIEPAVIIHPEFNWAMTSLDGISADRKRICEIKCSRKIYEKALQGIVDDIYFAQCQHHIFISRTDYCDFFAYWEGEYVLIKIDRDEEYIHNLCQKEKEFYDGLISFNAPAMTDRDYQKIDGHEYTGLRDTYKYLVSKRKRYECAELKIKTQLIELCNEKSSIGPGLKLTKYVIPGRVQYQNIPEIKDVNLDKYRKDAIESWRITEI